MNIKQLINDRTILFFICSLIVTGIAIYKSGTKNEPTNIQRKASKSATLYGNIVLSDDALIKTISPGEDITILGQRTPSGGNQWCFGRNERWTKGTSDKNRSMKISSYLIRNVSNQMR